ncbi:cell adhesion molecule 1-like [Myxocyprinus asiaticus]|uniref:cell adhesion molecule 1-like n=1 Tax=Myxocyprinus asiaticus TaxID=70543 RepID=UPI002221B38E|nr:cell adhesion molecule 1-like [Myxocyprinus asiaticus]
MAGCEKKVFFRSVHAAQMSSSMSEWLVDFANEANKGTPPERLRAILLIHKFVLHENIFFLSLEGSDDRYFEAIVGVVIAVVVLVLLLLLAIILRYMYKHKGTYHTKEAKGTEFAETEDAALRRNPVLQDTIDESKKEYFI